jgi:hypothetical protein
MARCVVSLCTLLVLLAVAPAGSANEAAPPPPKKTAPTATSAPLVIALDDSAREPRLEIPKAILNRFRASAEDGADDGTRRVEGVSPLHTIVGGFALSSAMAVGGLWLVRSRARSRGKTVGAVLIAAGFLALGASVLWADIPPYGRGRPVPPPPAPEKIVAGITLSDKVTVQVVDGGEAIRLIVSREQLGKVLAKGAPNSDKPVPTSAEPQSKK